MRRVPLRSGGSQKRYGAWIAASLLGLSSLYPMFSSYRARTERRERLDALDAKLKQSSGAATPLDPGIALRVTRLGPLLSSWETVGGCGAGSTGGTGVVKWIGRSTTGGLFQSITQLNYIHFNNGYNLVATEQLTRDLGEQWNVGVLVPYVYKWYDNYAGLPLDLSNAGIGDVNLLGTFRFGAINENSLMASLGIPTGTSHATYKGDPLTQEKQLGSGTVSGSLMLDHTMDEIWGLIVLGGLASWRGGENKWGNYRAPMASLYGYGGYFMGPFVPALGVSFSGFLKPDRDRGIDQDVPLLLVSANASIEWSNDIIAILLGVSVPYGLWGKHSSTENAPGSQTITGFQPWTAAIGVSVSPF